MPSFTSGLNPSQKKAVLHNQGPLLTLAGAGSGKTKVLTNRIARLVTEKLCAPSEILAVTFTNKAAKEMRERIAGLVGKKVASQMTVSTFHSLGVKILREDGEAIGLKKNFTILDDHQRLVALKESLRSRGGKKNKTEFDEIANSISMAKNANLDPDNYGESNPEMPHVERVYKRYQKIMQKRHSLDFDDLLLKPLRLFEQNADVLKKYQERYVYISIDEFQDTNAVQVRLAKLLAAPQNNIMVVGDDDQGIYSWRGADLDNIITFPSKFKGCTTIVLDRNYRSTAQILKGAHAVVANNRKRKKKDIIAVAGDGNPIIHYAASDEIDEAEWIADTIKQNVANERYRLKDHVLLFRANAMMRRFEEALRRVGISYKVSGASSFFDRKEIRDILAYFRFFSNNSDEISLMRVLKVPNKGITPSSIEKLEELAVRRRINLMDAIEKFESINNLPPAQIKSIKSFLAYKHKIDTMLSNGELSGAMRYALNESKYFDHLARASKEDKNPTARLDNVEEIFHGLEIFESKKKSGKPSLADYLHEISLMSADDDNDKGNSVTLMTLHKAKGLEFPVVFLCNLDDAVMPSPRSSAEGKIEEERRLFYVGMTRAERQLYLTYPRTKLFRKKTVDVAFCRFLNEIPIDCLDGRIGERAELQDKKDSEEFFAQMRKMFEQK